MYSSLIPFVLALFRERALRLTGPPEYAREREGWVWFAGRGGRDL